MTKKQQDQDRRDGIVGALVRFGRGKVLPPPGTGSNPYVPPSRKNRKSMTTWQDKVALKELRDVSSKTGISQQALIAEGLNYVLTKYRRHTVAT